MSPDQVPQEAIAAAEAYEDLHVPALFAAWAPRLLDAARVEAGHRVLDVASGTGVAARAAVERVGSEGFVAGVDPAPGMLAVARRLAPSVDWRRGTAESLPCEDATFDAVLCQFGLMFFEDRPQALAEMFRVLAPGGRAAIAVWDQLERSEAYPIEVELLERLAGDAAANALRAPFVLGDADDLTALLEAAGFGSVSVETHTETARFPSVRVMVEADLRGWLPVMGVVLEEEVIQEVLRQAETELAEYVTESGQVVFDAPAHVAAGKRPQS